MSKEDTILHGKIHEECLDLLIDLDLSADSYLDIGCGDGKFAGQVAKKLDVGTVVGLDVDRDCLLSASKILDHVVDIDLLSGHLPFRDASFDLVTGVEVIEHLDFGDFLLAEIHRTLRPDGHLLLTTPNLASWISRVLFLSGFQPAFSSPSVRYWLGLPSGAREKRDRFGRYGHRSLYSLRTLREILQLYGFSPISVKGVGGNWKRNIVTSVDRLMSKVPSLASGLVVLASKPGVRGFERA